jgi:hypothetical protein
MLPPCLLTRYPANMNGRPEERRTAIERAAVDRDNPKNSIRTRDAELN